VTVIDSLLEEDVHTPHPATEPTINNQLTEVSRSEERLAHLSRRETEAPSVEILNECSFVKSGKPYNRPSEQQFVDGHSIPVPTSTMML